MNKAQRSEEQQKPTKIIVVLFILAAFIIIVVASFVWNAEPEVEEETRIVINTGGNLSALDSQEDDEWGLINFPLLSAALIGWGVIQLIDWFSKMNSGGDPI